MGKLEKTKKHEVVIQMDKLLSFFDSEQSARKHSSSIKGLVAEELLLALLINFYHRRGEKAQVVSRQCTTGGRRGRQLDAWVRVGHSTGQMDYQVEVKSWSAHGVGGGSLYLPLMHEAHELAAYKQKVWGKYWKDGKFIDPGLNKVLDPMKPQEGAGHVLPLACLWAPVHPDGLEDPLFSVDPEDPSPFDTVWVFSASSFLRKLCANGEKELVLDLPLFTERMGWIGELFAIRQQTDVPEESAANHEAAPQAA